MSCLCDISRIQKVEILPQNKIISTGIPISAKGSAIYESVCIITQFQPVYMLSNVCRPVFFNPGSAERKGSASGIQGSPRPPSWWGPARCLLPKNPSPLSTLNWSPPQRVLCIGKGTGAARGAVAPPTKLLGKQLLHPAPPITYSYKTA